MVLLQLLGCADFAGWVRQYTYPPTFHYISTEQLRSTMWRLAYHSRELNQLLRSTGTIESNRKEILEHLGAMEQAATELNRTGWPSNHPLIDENRSNFLRDIKMAGDAIRREPPTFCSPALSREPVFTAIEVVRRMTKSAKRASAGRPDPNPDSLRVFPWKVLRDRLARSPTPR